MAFIVPIHWAFLQSDRTVVSQAQSRGHVEMSIPFPQWGCFLFLFLFFSSGNLQSISHGPGSHSSGKGDLLRVLSGCGIPVFGLLLMLGPEGLRTLTSWAWQWGAGPAALSVSLWNARPRPGLWKVFPVCLGHIPQT